MSSVVILRPHVLALLFLGIAGGAGMTGFLFAPSSARGQEQSRTPAAAEKVLQVSRIELVDSNGKKLVGLAALPDGTAGMSIYDVKGQQRINITIKADGQHNISLMDESGKPRVAVFIDGKTKQGMLYTDRGNATADMAPVPAEANEPPNRSRKPTMDQWKLLKLGMTTADVERVLGKPGKTSAISQRGDQVTLWYYPDAIGGFAGFGNGRLIRWRDSEGNEIRE